MLQYLAIGLSIAQAEACLNALLAVNPKDIKNGQKLLAHNNAIREIKTSLEAKKRMQ